MRRIPGSAGLAIAALAATACQTARIERTEAFAQAGIAYTESLGPVLDASFEAKVEANSLVLWEARELSECEAGEADCWERLASALAKDTERLQQRADLLRDFRRHAGVLRRYFQMLSSLATSDAPAEIGQSAGRLVTEAQALQARIRGESGDLDLKDLPERVTRLAVGAFQAAALRRALEDTAPAMRDELGFQTALLDSLSRQTHADLQTRFDRQDAQELAAPFAAPGKLPADWSRRRHAALQRQVALDSVEAASQAAKSLELAFEALVENRLDAQSFAGLVRDLNELVALVEVGHAVFVAPEAGGAP